MPRVRSNVVRLKRKKQIMKAARGGFGARSKLWKAAKENVERGWKYAYRDRKNKKRDFRKLWKAAKENVERGWKYAYRDRKNKKRDFRRLWITRINAGAHQNDLSYSKFMNGLRKAGIEVDRKILADLAVKDPAAFTLLAEKARTALNAA